MDVQLKVSGILHEKEGEGRGSPSFSRCLPFILFGLLIALGITAFVLTATGEVDWSRVQGPMNWMKNLAFASILPYLTNRVSNAAKGRRDG